MVNKLIHYKSSFEIGNKLYRISTYGCLILAVLSIILISRVDLMLLSFSFNLLLAFLYSRKIIRNLPGMLLLLLTNFIYIQVPFLFIFSKDTDFNFQGFIVTPNDDSFYYEHIFSGSLFFMICYIILIFGMIIGNSVKFGKSHISEEFKKSSTIYIWIIIGLITFYFIYLDNRANVAARTDEVAKGVSIFAFLFNDKTFQFIFPVLFFLIPVKSKTKSLTYFFFGVLLFFLLNLNGASKASILLVFTAFFLTPLAIFYHEKKEIIWPRKQLFIVGLIGAVPLFIFATLSREFSETGVTLSMELLTTIYDQVGVIDLSVISDLILIRLTAIVNNFLLIYSHYSGQIDLAYRMHFASYSTSSFLNLVLPGTPFPDAYVPTSQLFPKVLEQNLMESHLDNVTLRQQANTQPYSYFGVLMIIFGKPITIILTLLSGIFFSMLYQMTSKTYVKALLVFAFSVIFNSYAFEAGLQFIIITCLTAFLMVQLIKLFDSLKFA